MTRASVDYAAIGADLSWQATRVVSALCPLLLDAPEESLLMGETICALARQACGPEWADLAARRVTRLLAGKGWLRTEDEPRARALARQALTPDP